MESFLISYRFTLPDGSRERFDLHVDGDTLELLGDRPADLPQWTRLEFHQCDNCPLKPDQHPHCPLAASLVKIVEPLDKVVSYDQIHMEVRTEERAISQETTAQQAMSSLMGLVMAVSGCPNTAFLRPMARFHLPLANENETTYRSTSMYLLAQYFLSRAGCEAALKLTGLKELYASLHVVNRGIAARLRAASKTESALNAVVLLDLYTILLPDAIEESLEEIRYLFDAFLAPRS